MGSQKKHSRDKRGDEYIAQERFDRRDAQDLDEEVHKHHLKHLYRRTISEQACVVKPPIAFTRVFILMAAVLSWLCLMYAKSTYCGFVA